MPVELKEEPSLNSTISEEKRRRSCSIKKKSQSKYATSKEKENEEVVT